MAQMGLILFKILHWLLCCSLLGSSSYHLRKNCQKPPKNRSKFTFCDSIFSKLGSKSKNPDPSGASHAYGLSNTLNHLILSFSWSKLYCIKWTWPKNWKSRFFAWAYSNFFFWALFLDVFFDADSDGIWILAFGPPGAEKSRFFWFWTPHREILLSHFFKKSKICSKVAQMGLILFRILHWLLCCSLFGSSSYHLRKNCQKPPKNRSKLQL